MNVLKRIIRILSMIGSSWKDLVTELTMFVLTLCLRVLCYTRNYPMDLIFRLQYILQSHIIKMKVKSSTRNYIVETDSIFIVEKIHLLHTLPGLNKTTN